MNIENIRNNIDNLPNTSIKYINNIISKDELEVDKFDKNTAKQLYIEVFNLYDRIFTNVNSFKELESKIESMLDNDTNEDFENEVLDKILEHLVNNHDENTNLNTLKMYTFKQLIYYNILKNENEN